jgi:hypothetical protein
MARSNKPAAEVSEREPAPKAAPAETPVSTGVEGPKSEAPVAAPSAAVKTDENTTGSKEAMEVKSVIPEVQPKEKKGVRVLKDGTILTDNTFAEGAINPNQSPNVFFVQQPPKRRVDLAGGTVREDY